MNRRLLTHALKKSRLITFCFIVMLGITGLYIQYCFLFTDAAVRKYDFARRMGDDWYCYISDTGPGGSDELRDRIHKEYTSYTMRALWVSQFYSVYQYSEDAWEMFGYPLKDGIGFSSMEANEVIISEGLSAYSVGSVMELKVTDSAGRELDTLACTVVGILGQDEVVFPNHSDGGNFYFWNKSETFSEFSGKRKFLFLNPRMQLPDEDAYYESCGVFFDKSSSDDNELWETLCAGGKLLSMKEMYEESQPHREISYREYGIMCLFLVFDIICLFVWSFVVVKRSEDDVFYLLNVGFKRKKLYGYLCMASAVLLGIAYLLSYLAYFMPTDMEYYWQMNLKAPLAALAGYVVVWLISCGVFWGKYRRREFRSPRRIPCIADMSLYDNVCLCLAAKGYSPRAAAALTASLLEEHEISFCAKRKMTTIQGEILQTVDQVIKACSEGVEAT